MQGPHFLGIGQMKAATTWLYDQLNMHPAFWMPPVKEIGYLTRQTFPPRTMVQALERFEGPPRRLQAWLAKGGRDRLRPLDQRDRAFLARARAAIGAPWSLDTYAGLFEPAGGACTGDITPDYGNLPVSGIEEIGAAFPAIKAIQIVREPVERAWSEVCKAVRQGSVSEAQASDPAYVLGYLARPDKARRAEASRTADEWRGVLGEGRYLGLLFDDVKHAPEATLARVLEFLGVPPSASGLPPDFDRKAEQSRLPIPREIRLALAERYREEAQACARLFGGAAREWPHLHG